MNTTNSTHNLYDRLERLLTLMKSGLKQPDDSVGPLQPVHWQVLSYLARCNRFSDTTLAVVDYLGLTKGTVSQSLKLLEAKGLIGKTPDADDKRVSHLSLTDTGRDLLHSHLPPAIFAEGLETLTDGEQAQLSALLNKLLLGVQKGSGQKSFGQCASCKYNQPDPEGQANQFFCGLTQLPLSFAEVQLICREHQSP